MEAQQRQREMRERAAGKLTVRHQSSVTRTKTTGGTAFWEESMEEKKEEMRDQERVDVVAQRCGFLTPDLE